MDVSNIEITIEGTKYLGQDLPEDAQNALAHICDIRDQADKMQRRLVQLQVAEATFKEAIRKIVSQSEGSSDG